MMQSSYFGVNQLTVISTSTAFEEIFVNFPAYITFIIAQFEESIKLLLCRINHFKKLSAFLQNCHYAYTNVYTN